MFNLRDRFVSTEKLEVFVNDVIKNVSFVLKDKNLKGRFYVSEKITKNYFSGVRGLWRIIYKKTYCILFLKNKKNKAITVEFFNVLGCGCACLNSVMHTEDGSGIILNFTYTRESKMTSIIKKENINGFINIILL